MTKLIFENYKNTVFELSNNLVNNPKFLNQLKKIENEWYKKLVREFWLLERIILMTFLKDQFI